MKIVAAFLSVFIQSTHAAIDVAEYGSCVNMTQFNSNPPAGTDPGAHCHFSSDYCLDGETWLTPAATVTLGVSCTCDDDYHNNVFVAACYSMVTHQVVCAADPNECPEGNFILGGGSRYNSHHNVSDDCGDGTPAFGSFTSAESCGKQCLCNYAYRSRDNTVEAGTSMYGKCYNPTTNIQYCAATDSSCAAGEEYRGPHSSSFTGPECTCDRTHVGACVSVLSPGEFSFEHCAVQEDSCNESAFTFLTATALQGSGLGNDCRLCVNTWDAPTISPAPTVTVTAPPTSSPTLSVSPTISAAPTSSPTTNEPTPLPSAAATSTPTGSPVTEAPTGSPVTEAPTGSPTTVLSACQDRLGFRLNNDKRKSCIWISKKQVRITNQCKKANVIDNCRVVCGTCCANNSKAKFKIQGKKRGCMFLSNNNKKRQHCPKSRVSAICPQTCGRCCTDDSSFTFIQGGNIRDCKWVANKSERTKRWCPTVKTNCRDTCGNCKDFRIKPTTPPVNSPTATPVVTPTASPVRAPTASPVRAPVSLDDD